MFYQEVEFDTQAKRDIKEIFKGENREINIRIKAEKKIQSRLPKAFRDNLYLNELDLQKSIIENKKNSAINASIYGKYLFINFGRLLKYCIITNDLSWDNREENSGMFDLKIDFDKDVVIQGIYRTSRDGIYQVIAKDTADCILFILTWDCEKHQEVSMYQVKFSPGECPEYYITQGINAKMNYFIDLHQIFDLEYNIPIQESTNI